MTPTTSSSTLGEAAQMDHFEDAGGGGQAAATPAVTLLCLRKFEHENALLDEIVEAKLSPTRGVAALLGPKRTLHLVLLSAEQQQQPTSKFASPAASHQGKLVDGFLIRDVERCDFYL
jgi:hypothetical protein